LVKESEYIEYRAKLVVIMDNSSRNTTPEVRKFFKHKGIMCLTLPPNGDKYNPLSKVLEKVKDRVEDVISPKM